MKKSKIMHLIMEFICYEFILVILLLIANKIGLTSTPIIETSVCFSIGWIIWKVIMIAIDKHKK